MPDYNYPMTVRVFWKERHDGEWMPTGLADAILWLQTKLDEIPEEFRASASIEVDSVGSYEDSHYASIEISYCRPPTPAEIEMRRAEERKRAEGALSFARQRLAQEERRIAELNAAR